MKLLMLSAYAITPPRHDAAAITRAALMRYIIDDATLTYFCHICLLH